MAWRNHPARKHIPAEGLDVEIVGFQAIPSQRGLAVLQYREPDSHRRMIDIFNVESAEDFFELSCAESDEKVLATVLPDSSEDEDGHPQITNVRIDGYKEGYEPTE